MEYQSELSLLDTVMKLVRSNEQNYEEGDQLRCAYTDGKISGLVSSMQIDGHKAEYGSWKAENGCLRVGFLSVDGFELVKNGAVQQNNLARYKENLIPATEITIYQINPERDKHHVGFINLSHLEQFQGSPEIDSKIYDQVYTGKFKCTSMEDIFKALNVQRPDDYQTRSLSVSDVIEIRESELLQPGFYFCDSFGFVPIEFDVERTREAAHEQEAGDTEIFSEENTHGKVLVIEPEKVPEIREMDLDLHSLQTAVGGYIEAVYPYEDPVAIIVPEEGKLEGRPFNRALRDHDGDIFDVTAGTMLVVGCGEEDFIALNDEQLQKYEELFHTPQMFQYLGGRLVVTEVPVKAPSMAERMAQAVKDAAKSIPTRKPGSLER